MGQFFISRSRIRPKTDTPFQKWAIFLYSVLRCKEYNSLLVNTLNRIFKSNLSLNNFKWLLTKVELSCVRNIIPCCRKRLLNGYPVLNQELQNHDPFGRHIPIQVMYGSTPPPPGHKFTESVLRMVFKSLETFLNHFNFPTLMRCKVQLLEILLIQAFTQAFLIKYN